MTQAELAARIGSTQPALARLEAGGVTPNLDTLQRIAEALGLKAGSIRLLLFRARKQLAGFLRSEG